MDFFGGIRAQLQIANKVNKGYYFQEKGGREDVEDGNKKEKPNFGDTLWGNLKGIFGNHTRKADHSAMIKELKEIEKEQEANKQKPNKLNEMIK